MKGFLILIILLAAGYALYSSKRVSELETQIAGLTGTARDQAALSDRDAMAQRTIFQAQIADLNTQTDLYLANYRLRKQKLQSELYDLSWKRDSYVNTVKDRIAAIEGNYGSNLRMSRADIPKQTEKIKEEGGKKVKEFEAEIAKKQDEIALLESEKVQYESDSQRQLTALHANLRGL